MDSAADAFQRALREQRLRNARQINLLRLVSLTSLGGLMAVS